MKKKLLSVIIPAYNEEKTIVETIKETVKIIKKIGNLDFEFIIVDDGSIDNTYAAVRKFSDRTAYDIKVVSYSPNEGKGFALKKGALAAGGDFVLFMDADLEIHPDQLVPFLDVLRRSGADAVIGSKIVKGSLVKVPLKRKIISTGYYSLLRLLFRLPVADTQTGFKLFKKRPLADCVKKTTISGYTFDVELMVIMNIHKYKIIERSIRVDQLRMRRIRLLDSLPMLKDTLKVFGRCYFTKSYI